ncbi:MAG: Ig-like domain-containing protein [Candidatus Sulfotelmatobacter sp.]
MSLSRSQLLKNIWTRRVVMVIPALVLLAVNARAQTAVTTYHYDTYRTGWNNTEATLTPANVGSSSFGLLHNVALDDQVDSQPLVVPGVTITAGSSQGQHDVVYVATEGNTVYAIDVHSGAVLLSPNFGTPVQMPLGCNNNGPNVGINSTPVIDSSSNTLYVIIYTQDATLGPTYRVHALDLGSLTDKVMPQMVSASHALSNGTTFNFNATYQRQRPGLLLANGNVYAGFGSFCDYSANLSRGWLLGWNTGTLTPLPANRLNDLQDSSPHNFFLSSIWMSGYGPAADDSGSILFVTGNSDYSGTTYDGVTNIQESVVKVSSNLGVVLDLFTPSDQASLDQGDTDFGSGGVLVLPDQPGSIPHMAVAAGKDGNMYFLNEDDLGGYSTNKNNVLGTYSVGGCWCGESYFVDPVDGMGRVVASGGGSVGVWKVVTSPTAMLTNVTNSSGPGNSVQDPGFFTSISSNGTASPIIWALSRPATTSNGAPISLYAFDPESGGSTMTQLFKATAGAWPNINGNANLVPVVANGLVFVASHQQLQIFGLTGESGATTTTLSSSVNPSVSGKPVAFTATIAQQPGGAIPTGKVEFLNGTTVLATMTLASGSAKYVTSKLPLGTNPITAVYLGDSSHSGSTSPPVNQFVLEATTATLTSSANPSIYGNAVTFSATLTSAVGAPPNGEPITFMVGTTVLGTAALSNGTANIPISTLGVGTHAVKAVYGGDATFAASTSTALHQTVAKAASTTVLVSSLNSSVFGQSVTFTATVAPQFSGTPTGRVTFKNGTTNLGTAALSGGVASFTTAKLAAGTLSITAEYLGNASFTSSTSTPLSQVVNQAGTTVTLVSSLNPSSYRQSVTFTATVTPQIGGTVTGTVTFTSGANTLGTSRTNGGVAKLTISTLASGEDAITATYNGNSNFTTCSASLTQTVTP